MMCGLPSACRSIAWKRSTSRFSNRAASGDYQNKEQSVCMHGFPDLDHVTLQQPCSQRPHQSIERLVSLQDVTDAAGIVSCLLMYGIMHLGRCCSVTVVYRIKTRLV